MKICYAACLCCGEPRIGVGCDEFCGAEWCMYVSSAGGEEKMILAEASRPTKIYCSWRGRPVVAATLRVVEGSKY